MQLLIRVFPIWFSAQKSMYLNRFHVLTHRIQFPRINTELLAREVLPHQTELRRKLDQILPNTIFHVTLICLFPTVLVASSQSTVRPCFNGTFWTFYHFSLSRRWNKALRCEGSAFDSFWVDLARLKSKFMAKRYRKSVMTEGIFCCFLMFPF